MTFPGKLGDALHQFPVAYWWARQTGKKFTVWMDEKTCAPLKPLFEAQPCVEGVEFKPGIAHYNCGGQPWHFDLPTSEYEGKNVYHLGFRSMPVRQLTLETLESAKVPLDTITEDDLANTPCLEVEPADQVTILKDGAPLVITLGQKRLCLLHGQAVYAHTKSTPGFWKFLAGVESYLTREFDEVIFIGNNRDREVALRTYPHWSSYDDAGDFLSLARLMVRASLVIGVGSSPIALAGALKVPSVRVHDPIGENAKVIWSNLQPAHLNATEIELRKEWPAFRDRYLKSEVSVV
jgi:ADP-heptose:LPS heptosyltransferase